MPRNSQEKAHQHVFFRGNFTIQHLNQRKQQQQQQQKSVAFCQQSKPKTNKQTHRENFVTDKSNT
jgi:hypothetical protein